MIARAIAASVPFKWVAADTVYGGGDIEQQLRRTGKGYVLGVNSAHVLDLGQATAGRRYDRGHRPDAALIRLEAYRRAPEPKDRGCMIGVILEVADLEGEETNNQSRTVQTRGLLIRRFASPMVISLSSPPGVQLQHPSKRWSPSRIHRWAIEDSFETAKNEFGLDPQREPILAWLASSAFPWLCSPSP